MFFKDRLTNHYAVPFLAFLQPKKHKLKTAEKLRRQFSK